MSETRYSLLRDEVSRKVIAWLLIMAMMLGLVPSNFSIVAKAAEVPTLKLYLEKPSDWTTPVVNIWNTAATVEGNGTADIKGWQNNRTQPKLYQDETLGLYYVEVTNPNWTGFQFVDAETAAELKFDDAALLKKFNEATEDTSYYYLKGDKEEYAWYTDAEGKNALTLEEIEAKEEYYLVGTISPIGWNAKSDEDAKLIKNEDGTYSITIENVEPGKQEFKVLQDPDNFAWKYAWGGTGSGGNYVLELEATSKVTITMDPADTKKQLVVVAEASEVSPSEPVSPEKPVSPSEPVEDVKSPVYADGMITFNLVTKASVAGIKGAMIEAWSKTVPMEKTSFGFTYSIKVPEPGIYDYGMVSGSKETWESDPLNKTRKANGGNPIIVSNPIAGNGESYVYLPSTEENLDAKVLYKTKEEKTYKEVKFEKAEGYDNLYVAAITEVGTFEYLVKVGDEEATKDPYNYTEKEIVVKKEIKKPEFTSPVLDEENGKVTFNYWAPDAGKVLLAGSMTGWASNAVEMKKNKETGLFSTTLDLAFGSYQYKYVVEGKDWVTDPVNPEMKDGNSAFTFGTLEPQVDSETSDVTFTYYVKDYAKTVEKAESVKLMGLTGVTYVDENGKEIPADWSTGLDMVKNADGNFTITIKNMPAGQYEYKFKANNATWLKDNRNPDGDDNSVVTVPGVVVSADNIAGAGTYQLGIKVLGDAKTADEGSVKFSMTEAVEGMSITKDGVLTVTDAAKTGYFTVKLEYTADKEAKSSTSQFYYTENAVIYEYVPTEGEGLHAQMDKADVYTWNNAATGSSFHFKNIGTEEKAKYVAYVTLDKNIESFGYILRLFGAWGDNDREFSDRTIYVNQGEKYTKIKGGDGVEKPYTCASGITGYDDGIIFRYRDDQKFHDGTMDTIEEVKVVINDKPYKMTYSEKDELFTFPYQNISTGDYEYYFLVDGKKVEDQYNKSGVLHYESAKGAKVNYECTNNLYSAAEGAIVANYDQNPAVRFELLNAEGKEIELSDIDVDLSALNSTNVKFSTVTNKGVLYIDRSVAQGTYEVKVTLTDKYGNHIPTAIPVKVVEREAEDKSWDESRVYFIVTDRFNDGDASNNGTLETGYNKDKIEAYHGGDLKGITQKLSYLQELGINTIWITPIVDNVDQIVNADLMQTGYHGYWAKDFTKLDEHLGTTEDLDELLDEAHKHGIKVMVDIVVNHSGYDDKEKTQLTNFKGMLREGDEVGTDFIHGGYNSDLPDFKTEVPEVRNQLIAWQTAWASHTTANGNSIDYFRVDTVKHVEHETWSELKTALAEVNPAFKMIGEFYGASYNNTGDYLGNGEMDAELDFDFKSIAGKLVNGDVESAETYLETRNTALSSSVTMGQFLSSHDEDGFVYGQGGDLAKGKLGASLQMTAKGIPVIYYGEEIGLSGPNAFGEQNNNRYDMVFDNLTDDQKDMLAHYKKLLAAREMYSEVLATGTRTKVAGSNEDGYLVFRRGEGADAVYVALNTTDKAQKISFKVDGIQTVTGETPELVETMTDIYGNKTYAVVDNTVEITVPAMKNGGTAILGKGDSVKLTGIQAVAPTKTTYKIGEKLNLDNLSVVGTYGKAKIAIPVSKCKVNSRSFDSSKAGTYTIDVYYGNGEDMFETSFDVKVVADPTVTPTKKPTVAPTKAPAKIYTIKYNLAGGTNNKANPNTYSTKDVKLSNPSRKGYAFAGWYVDGKKITAIKASEKKNVTVTAKWTKIKVARATVKTCKNSKSKQVAVTLKKVTGAKGYEIKYSTSKTFKKSKTLKVTKTQATLKKLTKGKTYYIKARAYKTDSTGQKVYGKYSTIKKVVIKK